MLKFNSDEEYWRWYGKKEGERILDEYFGKEINKGDEDNG